MQSVPSTSWFPTKGFGTPQTWIVVDLGAIRRNFDRFAARFDPGVKIVFAVKKDAYGHGLAEVARALADHPRLEAFGVSTAAEALFLREAGIETPILVLAVLGEPDLLDTNCHPDIVPTVTAPAEAEAASSASRLMGTGESSAHLKIDTGMGRLGRRPEEVLAELPRFAAAAAEGLRVAAVYTHLSDGTDRESALAQWRALREFAAHPALAGATLHVGGSDAVSIADEIPPGAAVRAGIAIFGYHPAIPELEPAMTFASRVLYRRRAPAGTRISYGGTHVLKRDSELALVGAGYGNGYPRALSNKGEVLIREVRRPVLGRVCMDQIVVDATDGPDVEIGDEAVLFGRQGRARLGADEVAERAGTIAYELTTIAGQINPRLYEGA